jgi:23S rRNA (guanosine2251-2'-O)-methyltransferase
MVFFPVIVRLLAESMENKNPAFLYGINPVTEALRAGKRTCQKIVVADEKPSRRITLLLDWVRRKKIPLEKLPKQAFRQKYAAVLHQGVVGFFSFKETTGLDELVRQAFKESTRPTLALLDGIQDPQNLGSILRSAESLGVSGIVMPRRGSPELNETVAKCSSGAIEYLPVALVTNLSEAMKQLKKENFWVVGVDVAGEVACFDYKFDQPTALVIGSEEKGLRPLVRKLCDTTVTIPMAGKLGSLNAAAASAVIFYEVARQRETAEK